jgi:hypothetical protein
MSSITGILFLPGAGIYRVGGLGLIERIVNTTQIIAASLYFARHTGRYFGAMIIAPLSKLPLDISGLLRTMRPFINQPADPI